MKTVVNLFLLGLLFSTKISINMEIAHESLPPEQVNNTLSKELMKSAIWHISTNIVPEEIIFQKIKCRDIFPTPQAIVELFANYLPDHSSLQQRPFE